MAIFYKDESDGSFSDVITTVDTETLLANGWSRTKSTARIAFENITVVDPIKALEARVAALEGGS